MTQISKDVLTLDALTGGAFTAPTSGDRAARIREWLASDPAVDQIQAVFRELSLRDKGAARPLRERLDEIKRSRSQDVMVAEWGGKAHALLAQSRMNIADAMAWQRDAAKAGAPLGREPLLGVKTQLADRVKRIEDLQHRIMVQREAAVLLAQRIEVLSTKSWRDAAAASDTLREDVAAWQQQALALESELDWGSLESRFPPMLQTSRGQLQAVCDAFEAALAQAQRALVDPQAALPAVAVWADELARARQMPAASANSPSSRPASRVAVAPETAVRATERVGELLVRLESELTNARGKGVAAAAQALRASLKEHAALLDAELTAQAQAQLAVAAELEGSQRRAADQIREELVAQAEALFEMGPAAVDGTESPPKPKYGGRRMQETLRTLRERWKQVDQSGPPNHALWKRFDEACNRAYEVVHTWLDKVKQEAAQHRAHRIELIEELKAWAAAQPGESATDWKAANRALHQFADRWRAAGHLSERAFAELQPMWKEVFAAAAAPLEAAQRASTERRQAMIAEASALGAAEPLRIDAVRALQQRWQAEAQVIPLDRRHEQKLWDAFRKPIDDAFARKTAQREREVESLSAHDQAVLHASREVEAAVAGGNAQQIRVALNALDAVLRGAALVASSPAVQHQTAPALPAVPDQVQQEQEVDLRPEGSGEPSQGPVATARSSSASQPSETAPAPSELPRRPVVAVRGDDRPGARRPEPSTTRGRVEPRRPGATERRSGTHDGLRAGAGDRGPGETRGVRLGDTAFRAQRNAIEHAQIALRRLSAQAHGEALTQLLTAWRGRDPDALPSAQEFGRAVSQADRANWRQAIATAPSGDGGETLLRLEIAAEVPSPPDALQARRALQLQLLTRRHDPSPAQTWVGDTARLLCTPHTDAAERRLQSVLKVLLRR